MVAEVGLRGCEGVRPTVRLLERVREVQEVLGSYDEISALVTSEGSMPIPRDEAFSVFAKVRYWTCLPFIFWAVTPP